jgi:hypothetical protein
MAGRGEGLGVEHFRAAAGSGQPMDADRRHDTHAEAVISKFEHPAVKWAGHDEVKDIVAAGESVVFTLNDGRHLGKVQEKVCTLEELMEGNLHVRIPGQKAHEWVYRIAYESKDGDKLKSKSALFKRSDFELAKEVSDRGESLPGPYAQEDAHKSGAFEAHNTTRKAPHRGEMEHR